MSDKKILLELEDLEWIHLVYETPLKDCMGYFIQFFDSTFIVGKIIDDVFKYNLVQIRSLIPTKNEAMSEKFVKFVRENFEGEFASEEFMEKMCNKFGTSLEKDIDLMSDVELNAEMHEAARRENFERAALIKRKLG